MFTNDFWDNFVSEYWDKKPTCFKNTGFVPVPEMNALMLFHALVTHMASGDDAVPVRIYGNGNALSKDYAAPLLALDLSRISSFKDLIKRTHAALNVESFGVIVDNVGKLDPAIQERIAQFISPLVNRIGLPAKQTEIGLFGGSYKKTPFGIHRDIGNDNFTFGVVGEKKFLLWPPEYFNDAKAQREGFILNRDGLNDERIYCDEASYQRFKRDAICLTIKPGDVMYWPDWWHTADNEPGEIQLTLSLGLWRQVNLANFGSDLINRALTTTLKEKSIHRDYCANSNELPEVYSDLLNQLKDLVENGEIEAMMNHWWKDRFSRKGFSNPF